MVTASAGQGAAEYVKRGGITMKKLSIVLSALLWVACSTSAPQRTVTDNTIYSKFPKLNISVNPDFKYLGMKTKTEFPTGGPMTKMEAHTFEAPGKFVLIKYRILAPNNWFTYPITFSDRERYFIIDREKMLNRDVPYAIEYDKKRACLAKHVARDFGRGGFIYLLYVERADYSANFPFHPSDWGDYEELAPEQKTRVEEFKKSYEANITFSK